jgi:uncharacterized protein (TIGR00730 family)
MKKIVVFCGASSGLDPIYQEQAYLLGKTFAQEGIKLIYGGANVGLMKAVANGVMENGGQATGVFPRFLSELEVAHKGLTELIIVETMHERKLKMHELSDAVIALPGGFGTLEELFEMLTWGQLGLHQKPIGILNLNGFYNELLAMADKMVATGFLKDINRKMLITGETIPALLDKIFEYKTDQGKQWMTEEKT